MAIIINSYIQIPLEEIEFTFARSGGPGGQNVNKVNSKALLRWSVQSSPSLPEAVRERFLRRYASRITTEGEILLTSQKYRDQSANVEDCTEKLREMIVSVLAPPTPRKATKPSKQAKERRIQKKRETGKIKQQRKKPGMDD